MKATKSLIDSKAPEGFENLVLKCVICGGDVPARRATSRSRDTCSPECNDVLRAYKKWQTFHRVCPSCFHPNTPEERADFLAWRKARGDRRPKAGRPKQSVESILLVALRSIAEEPNMDDYNTDDTQAWIDVLEAKMKTARDTLQKVIDMQSSNQSTLAGETPQEVANPVSG